MPTLQVTSEINIELDKVLAGVDKLDTPELEQFLSQVSMLLARRKAPNLSKRETELLQKINQGLPSELQQRYDVLTAKLEAETISAREHQALLNLIDQIEHTDVERLQALIELAQLRNLSLEALLTQLGIQAPPVHG